MDSLGAYHPSSEVNFLKNQRILKSWRILGILNVHSGSLITHKSLQIYIALGIYSLAKKEEKDW